MLCSAAAVSADEAPSEASASQHSNRGGDIEEVFVTARRREESARARDEDTATVEPEEGRREELHRWAEEDSAEEHAATDHVPEHRNAPEVSGVQA